MLEIPPLSPAYPVLKPGKIKKNDTLSKQPRRNKKPLVENNQPIQHIDEIV